jgi:hypothetical protein
MGWMMRRSSSLFLNFVDEITQKKISVHGTDGYQEELHKLVSLDRLETKYGGYLPDIQDTFFPPDMSIRQTTPMTMNEVKNEVPDAFKYVAPWGLKKA